VCILWIEDENNPGDWLNVRAPPQGDFEVCIVATPGVTQYSIPICRLGQGPVSINDVNVTQPVDLDIGSDQIVCIDNLTITISLTVNEPAGQNGSTWSDSGGNIAIPTAAIIAGEVGQEFTFTYRYTYDASGQQGMPVWCPTIVFTIVKTAHCNPCEGVVYPGDQIAS
jgi:hypothetical protein